ncbi:MAG: metallophosphoesterase [Candidatus Lokiarchaeota archaeon]
MFDKFHLEKLIIKPKKINNLNFDEISEIINTANKIFRKENLILKLHNSNKNSEIFVIGDIHGNLESLIDIIEEIKTRNPKYVIFLGDIVDRGDKQIECLIFVLSLKIMEPNRYFILRGNHETLQMNQYYGFYEVFINKYGNDDKFRTILNMYESLPIASIINHKVICVHGGVPEDMHILSRMDDFKLNELNNSIKESIQNGIYQLIWNDPKENISGFSDSFRGPGIKFYGNDVFQDFLEMNNLEGMIRGHECFPEGYRWFFNKKLLSIFSSANYRGYASPNPASYAIIKDDKIQVELL